jgi:hypothetical protein
MGFRFAIVYWLSASAVALAQTKLNVAVMDSRGASIPNAVVAIHWDSAGSSVGLKINIGVKPDILVKTDDNGSFTIELPPGFYDVFVSATAFSPNCRKVRIKQVPQTISFRLKVDPLVLTELGDPIVSEPTRR